MNTMTTNTITLNNYLIANCKAADTRALPLSQWSDIRTQFRPILDRFPGGATSVDLDDTCRTQSNVLHEASATAGEMLTLAGAQEEARQFAATLCAATACMLSVSRDDIERTRILHDFQTVALVPTPAPKKTPDENSFIACLEDRPVPVAVRFRKLEPLLDPDRDLLKSFES
jgi:hypothetical protein